MRRKRRRKRGFSVDIPGRSCLQQGAVATPKRIVGKRPDTMD